MNKKQLEKAILGRNERIVELENENYKIREELGKFQRIKEKIKQENCKHYWIEKERHYYNNVNLDKYRIEWHCEDCGISKEEYMENK